MWFMNCYLGLFLLAPILNAAKEQLSTRQHAYSLILLTIASMYLGGYWQMKEYDANGYSIAHFVYLYWIGAFLRRVATDEKRRAHRWYYLGAYIGAALLWGTCAMAIAYGHYMQHWNVWGYNNPFLLLTSIAFFLFMMSWHFKSKIINWLAMSSLGVYLLNDMVIQYDFLRPYAHMFGPWQQIGLLLGVAILFYAFAVAIDQIRILLLHPVPSKHTVTKERITYLDLARGLAILLVIFYHVPLYIRICHPAAAELLVPHINAGTYILPFFMPVFFVISGYFTNTAKNYWQFLWGDVKNLLLVGLLLTFVNVLIQTIGLQDSGASKWFFQTLLSVHFLDIILSNWFVAAIFFARQVYFGIDRLSQYISKEHKGLYWLVELTMLTIIAIAGVLIEPHAPHNGQWFYCQGLVFAIFIAFGKLLREYPLSKWWMLGTGGVYILLKVVANLAGWSTLEYGMINTSFTMAHWPFYMLLALCGSALLIGVAQRVNQYAPLEFIGRHSLIFYIPQGGILYVTATLLGKLFLPDSPIHVWYYILIMWTVTLLGLSAISWIQEGWQYWYNKFCSRKQ